MGYVIQLQTLKGLDLIISLILKPFYYSISYSIKLIMGAIRNGIDSALCTCGVYVLNSVMGLFNPYGYVYIGTCYVSYRQYLDFWNQWQIRRCRLVFE